MTHKQKEFIYNLTVDTTGSMLDMVDRFADHLQHLHGQDFLTVMGDPKAKWQPEINGGIDESTLIAENLILWQTHTIANPFYEDPHSDQKGIYATKVVKQYPENPTTDNGRIAAMIKATTTISKEVVMGIKDGKVAAYLCKGGKYIIPLYASGLAQNTQEGDIQEVNNDQSYYLSAWSVTKPRMVKLMNEFYTLIDELSKYVFNGTIGPNMKEAIEEFKPKVLLAKNTTTTASAQLPA